MCEADKMAQELIRMRRTGEISSEVNIAYTSPQTENGRSELYVNCDQGRVRRPVIVIENSKPKLTREHVEAIQRGEMRWSDLIERGVIEYLDAEEEENAATADP